MLPRISIFHVGFISLATLYGLMASTVIQAQTVIAPPALSAVVLQTSPPPSSILGVDTATLRGDARLAGKLTLMEHGTTLRDLLHHLESDTLYLRVYDDCAEQRVEINLKQRPLHLVMNMLAQLVGGHWEERTNKDGYTLFMDRKNVTRRAEWWRLYMSERNKAIASYKSNTLAAMRRTVHPTDPNSPAYQKNPGDPELEAQSAHSHNTFNLLPSGLQEKIADALNPIYFYDVMGFSGEIPHEGGVVVHLNELPDAAQKVVHTTAPYLKPDEDPLIHFANVGTSVGAEIVRPGSQWYATGLDLMGVRQADIGMLAVCKVDHMQLAVLVQQMGKNASPEWQQLAAYQRSRVWPDGKAHRLAFPPGGRPRQAQVLDKLRRQASLEYVSDSYSQFRHDLPKEERTRPLERPLDEELDLLADMEDASWKRDASGVCLFRNNRWYRDDGLEISEAFAQSLLKQWGAFLKPPTTPVVPGKAATRSSQVTATHEPAALSSRQRIEAQMELESAILDALTPWQITNGLRWYRATTGPFAPTPQNPEGAGCIFEDISTNIMQNLGKLRFYGSLSPTQRTALLDGQLSSDTLSEAQMRQLTQTAPEVTAWAMQAASGSLLLRLQQEKTVLAYLRDGGFSGPAVCTAVCIVPASTPLRLSPFGLPEP